MLIVSWSQKGSAKGQTPLEKYCFDEAFLEEEGGRTLQLEYTLVSGTTNAVVSLENERWREYRVLHKEIEKLLVFTTIQIHMMWQAAPGLDTVN